MKTREQIFSEFVADLRNKAEAVLNQTLGELEVEYLPWIETDTESNVYHVTRRILDDFLSGKDTEEVRLACSGYRGKEIRRKIFDEIGDELKGQRVKDLEEEVERLRSELKAAWNRPF